MARKRRGCICTARSSDPTCRAHGLVPSSEWERWNDEDDAAMQEAWLTMHDEEEPQTWQEWLLGESDGADEPWGCVLAQAIGYVLLLALVIGVMVVLAP